MGSALKSGKDETRGGNITGDLHCSMILEYFLVFLVIGKQRCLHYLQIGEDNLLMVLFFRVCQWLRECNSPAECED